MPDPLPTLIGLMASTTWLGPSTLGDDTGIGSEWMSLTRILFPAQLPPMPTGLVSTRQATTRRTTSITSRLRTTTGRKWSQSTQTSPGRVRPVVGEYEAPPSLLLPRSPLPHFLFHILILVLRHSRTPEGTLASSKRSSKQPSPESKRPSGKKSALKHQQPGVLLSPGGLQGSNAQVSYDKNSRVYHLTP